MSSTPVLKISEEGYSIDDGDERLLFNSAYPTLKIVTIGSSLFEFDGTTTTEQVTIYHNLGYVPLVRVVSQIFSTFDSPSTKYYRVPSSNYLGLQGTFTINFTVDDEKIVLTATYNGAYFNTGDLNFFYAIYYDEDA